MKQEIKPSGEKMSAQSIIQKLFEVSAYQEILDEHPSHLQVQSNIHKLEKQLRVEIEKWGGLEIVDQWLSAHDPGHGKSTDIKNLDLTWLKEEVL